MRAFLFYIDDWLSSKKVAMMDAAEERGYLRLLLNAATEDDCGLPDDDAVLAIYSMLGPQWSKETADESKRIGGKTSGEKLRECFEVVNGRLYNTRLLKEFLHQKEVNAKRSVAGKTGAQRKQANAKQLLQQMNSVCLTDAIANDKQTGKQNATNDVCVCASVLDTALPNDNSESLESADVSHRNSEEQEVKPSAIANADWFEFKALAESAGMSGSSVDWDKAFTVFWRYLDFTQRQKATQGIRDRIGTQDYALAAIPPNYFERRMWERSVRKPAVIPMGSSSDKNARRTAAVERIKREMAEAGETA